MYSTGAVCAIPLYRVVSYEFSALLRTLLPARRARSCARRQRRPRGYDPVQHQQPVVVTCGSRCVGSSAASAAHCRYDAPHHNSNSKVSWNRPRAAPGPRVSRRARARWVWTRFQRRRSRLSCPARRSLLQQRRRVYRSKRALRGRALVIVTQPASKSELAVHQAACSPAAAPGAALYRLRRLHAFPWRRARGQVSRLPR